MHENNTTPEQVQDLATKPSYEELEAQVGALKHWLDIANQGRDTWINKYIEVKNFIQESINREDWSESELAEPFWTELAELMNLEINREVNVTVTVTFTGTMTLPIGTDPEDLYSYDWSAELAHDCYSSDFSVDDITARES